MASINNINLNKSPLKIEEVEEKGAPLNARPIQASCLNDLLADKPLDLRSYQVASRLIQEFVTYCDKHNFDYGNCPWNVKKAGRTIREDISRSVLSPSVISFFDACARQIYPAETRPQLHFVEFGAGSGFDGAQLKNCGYQVTSLDIYPTSVTYRDIEIYKDCLPRLAELTQEKAVLYVGSPDFETREETDSLGKVYPATHVLYDAIKTYADHGGQVICVVYYEAQDDDHPKADGLIKELLKNGWRSEKVPEGVACHWLRTTCGNGIQVLLKD